MNAESLTLTYFLTAVGITCIAEGSYQLLDDNLLHYEALHYDSRAVHDQHERLEGDNRHLYVHFHAYGRDFNLQLSRDRVPLGSDFQLIYEKTSISDPDLSFLYTGVDTGWASSEVHGAVVHGTFQGIIHLHGDTTYHVEPSNRMFSELPPFHSIIYSEKDYNWSYRFPEAVSGVQNKFKYNHFYNDGAMPEVSRTRRAVDTRLTNKTCTLRLVTDHTLWRFLMDRNNQHDNNMEACDGYSRKQEPSGGLYLMHSIAQRGHLPNNKRFSDCSLDSMSGILSNPNYTSCFQGSTMPPSFCGNSITEDGEECDCGMSDTCSDLCCHGFNSSSPELGCTLTDGAKCSPSEGPCCNSTTCQVIGKHEDFVCQNTRPCVDQLICDGMGSACPEPKPTQIREDGYICNKHGRMCEAGSCSASICRLIGWRECQLINDKTRLTLEEKVELCTVGCKKNSKSECIRTDDEAKIQTYPAFSRLLQNISSMGGSSMGGSSMRETLRIQFPIGMPCNSMTGYCDVFDRCRGVDPDTPLVQLKNCIINISCIRNFMEEHWGKVTVISLAICVFTGLFVKVCAVHTKSSNPDVERRHPRRSVHESINFDSLRRVGSTLRRSRPPPSPPPEYELDTRPDTDPSEPLDPENVKMADTSRMN